MSANKEETDELLFSIKISGMEILIDLKKTNYTMDIYISENSEEQKNIILYLEKKINVLELRKIENIIFNKLELNLNTITVYDKQQFKRIIDNYYAKFHLQGKPFPVAKINSNTNVVRLNKLSIPQFISLQKLNQLDILEKEEVIKGVATTSNVALLIATSKAGKSQSMIELAVAVASGNKWFGELECAKGKVLFINLELDEFNFRKRMNNVLNQQKVFDRNEVENNIDILNCRGHNIDIDTLTSLILEKSKTEHYKLIIIDPVYVIGEFDENSANQVGEFMRRLVVLSENSNSLIFITHHSSKGDKTKVSAIDRGSGSGSFARAADVLFDMSEIDGTKISDGFRGKYFRIESTLRNFQNLDSFEIEYKYPTHVVVNGLEDAPLLYGGSGAKRKDYDLSVAKAITLVGTNVSQVAKNIGVTEQTVRNNLKKSKKFFIKNNQIFQKEDI